MCRVLDVSSSGYYAWRQRPSSPREMANETLLKEIQAAHEASKGVYGSPRIYHEVKEKVSCSQNRVARLMKKHGIAAKQKRRYKQTTKANGAHPVAPNLVDRAFGAAAPNEKWTTDITYIPTLEGWLYLAVVLDLFSRRIVGWAMSARMTSGFPPFEWTVSYDTAPQNRRKLHEKAYQIIFPRIQARGR